MPDTFIVLTVCKPSSHIFNYTKNHAAHRQESNAIIPSLNSMQATRTGTETASVILRAYSVHIDYGIDFY